MKIDVLRPRWKPSEFQSFLKNTTRLFDSLRTIVYFLKNDILLRSKVGPFLNIFSGLTLSILL